MELAGHVTSMREDKCPQKLSSETGWYETISETCV